LNGTAKTAAAANAQQYELPARLDDWRAFARLVDGYKIAEELGYDLLTWGKAQDQHYRQTGTWELNVLGLRLMLFWEYRADYWTGYTYHERDGIADSLLRELSRQTGLPYVPDDQ
jgi:hypothetical protein